MAKEKFVQTKQIKESMMLHQRIYNRKMGHGIILQEDNGDNTVFVMWDNGTESWHHKSQLGKRINKRK